MFPSACSFIVLVFTTCFDLDGHLQVCRIFYFHMLVGFCFAAFFLPFFHVVTVCMFPFVFFSSVFLRYFCSFLACVCLLALSLLPVCICVFVLEYQTIGNVQEPWALHTVVRTLQDFHFLSVIRFYRDRKVERVSALQMESHSAVSVGSFLRATCHVLRIKKCVQDCSNYWWRLNIYFMNFLLLI
jgi:hypothetical protein